MKKERLATIQIYYDKKCPMCNVFANTISKHDKQQILKDANIATDKILNLPKNQLLKEIHLIEEDGTTRVGADAIFTSLSRIYPILKPLSFLVRLPVINKLAKIIYLFVAKRRLLFSSRDDSRLYWLFIITNLGLLSGLLITIPAWQTDRTYPFTPILNEINSIAPFSNFLFWTLIINLFFSLLQYKKFSFSIYLSLVLLLPLIILDITRLQPWILHYSGILFILSWANLKKPLRSQQILDAARWVVVSIYFWSGIQKMNSMFILEVFPSFTKALWLPFGVTGLTIVFFISFFIPLIESAFALGLLTKRFRKISIIGSFLMFIFVIISLTGNNWNSSVWPWNFVIFGMVLILFYRYDNNIVDFLNRSKKNFLAILAILIFTILPLTNFFGFADYYVSWSLYSGHVPTANLTATNKTINKILPNYHLNDNSTNTIPFVKWSMNTMNIVPYPEKRVFLNIFTEICKKYEDSQLNLTIETRSFPNSHKITQTNYSCENINE